MRSALAQELDDRLVERASVPPVLFLVMDAHQNPVASQPMHDPLAAAGEQEQKTPT